MCDICPVLHVHDLHYCVVIFYLTSWIKDCMMFCFKNKTSSLGGVRGVTLVMTIDEHYWTALYLYSKKSNQSLNELCIFIEKHTHFQFQPNSKSQTSETTYNINNDKITNASKLPFTESLLILWNTTRTCSAIVYPWRPITIEIMHSYRYYIKLWFLVIINTKL